MGENVTKGPGEDQGKRFRLGRGLVGAGNFLSGSNVVSIVPILEGQNTHITETATTGADEVLEQDQFNWISRQEAEASIALAADWVMHCANRRAELDPDEEHAERDRASSMAHENGRYSINGYFKRAEVIKIAKPHYQQHKDLIQGQALRDVREDPDANGYYPAGW